MKTYQVRVQATGKFLLRVEDDESAAEFIRNLSHADLHDFVEAAGGWHISYTDLDEVN